MVQNDEGHVGNNNCKKGNNLDISARGVICLFFCGVSVFEKSLGHYDELS